MSAKWIRSRDQVGSNAISVGRKSTARQGLPLAGPRWDLGAKQFARPGWRPPDLVGWASADWQRYFATQRTLAHVSRRAKRRIVGTVRCPSTNSCGVSSPRKIDDGLWQPGILLPSEAVLTLTYRISRTVIRQALDLLSGQRRMKRIKGKGIHCCDALPRGDLP